MNENLSKIHKASFQSIELEDEGVLYFVSKICIPNTFTILYIPSFGTYARLLFLSTMQIPTSLDFISQNI
jgi:hypothetical protein